MSKLVLLTSQRNQLLQLLLDLKFDRSDFAWGEAKSQSIFGGSVPELRHIQTRFAFVIDRLEYQPGESRFYVRYSPGRELQDESRFAAGGNWAGVVEDFSKWLNNVRRETDLPDLWENLAKDTQLIQDADQQPSDNLPFTEAELPRVRQALEEIKAYVHKTHDLSETQKRIIDSRFDYLKEKADEFGRKDWMHVVISILLGIGVDHLRSGDGTRDLFLFSREVFKQALGTVLYLVGPH